MGTRESVSRQILASPSNALLALRMSSWVLVLPLAKRVFPVERLARFMWRDGRGLRIPEQESYVIRLGCRLTRFSGSNCLERSLILYRYLGSGGADPTLVLGVGTGEGQQRLGHAWLVVDGAPLIDSQAELEKYEPFVAFGPGARRISEPIATSSTPR
jgi:hypothetical protein